VCCRAQLHVLANRDRDQKVDRGAIAIIPEPLNDEALGNRPHDVPGAEIGWQGPGDLGGEPGIAGVAPVSVPARRYIEMQVDPQRRPWGDRGEFGYEPRRHRMRLGGGPGRRRQRGRQRNRENGSELSRLSRQIPETETCHYRQDHSRNCGIPAAGAGRNGRERRGALSFVGTRSGERAMASLRTLAVDIGGTGVRLALLDDKGRIIGKSLRVPTPMPPVAPEALAATIDAAAAPLGQFDRASVGFPGMVRNGRVLTAPHLGTEVWAGFDLQQVLAERWKKPVRVMNDADVQGFGAIKGRGVEMVLTLGTGAGTALFEDGRVLPHLELAHHPIHGKKTYDEYIGNAALDRKGHKTWNKRVERAIGILRRVINFDHLYLGGGNAKHISFALPSDVTIVPNSDGLTGGIALWRDETETSSPLSKRSKTAKRKNARPRAG